MYYLVYKTTNTINGRYYIGAHATENLNDEYLGSGVALSKAIEKYGKQFFERKILHICETKEEMYLIEEKLVNHNDPLSYNLRRGGKGGWDHVDSRGDKNPMKRPEVVEKVVSTSRNNGSYYTEKRIQHQKLMSQRASEKFKGKSRPEHSSFMKEWSKKYWKENREEIRNSLSSFFKLVSPQRIEYTTNRLQEFCEEHNLTYTSIWNTTRTNKCVKKGKSKGWICMKITQL